MQSLNISPAELREACSRPDSLNLFAGLLLGDLMEYEFPETHVAYWALLVTAAQSGEKELRYALGLPRGFAKTTLIKLFLVWMVLYTDHRFFLIVSATIGLAKDVLADIMGFFDSQNLRAIWGHWDKQVETDTKEDVRFTFLGKYVIFKCIGAESSVRGVNVDNERPSVIICEDAQTSESAESEEQNKKFIRWFLGTLLKARSYRTSFVVYIGNMYNERCLLNQLRMNDGWISLITSAILANGESLWPAFRTKESLLQEYLQDESLGEGKIFMAEVMNDPTASKGTAFDMSKVPAFQYDEDITRELVAGYFIIIDPATGKKKGDDTAIGICACIGGRGVLLKVVADKLNESDTVKETIRLILQYRATLVAVEAVGYQVALGEAITKQLRHNRISGVHVAPLLPSGQQKNNRIASGMRAVFSGEVGIHPLARGPVFKQAQDYDPRKTNNVDDILDVVGYINPTLEKYWEFIHLPEAEGGSETPRVYTEEETNCF